MADAIPLKIAGDIQQFGSTDTIPYQNINIGTVASTIPAGNDSRFKSDDMLIREALGSVIVASTLPVTSISTQGNMTSGRLFLQAMGSVGQRWRM